MKTTRVLYRGENIAILKLDTDDEVISIAYKGGICEKHLYGTIKCRSCILLHFNISTCRARMAVLCKSWSSNEYFDRWLLPSLFISSVVRRLRYEGSI